MGCGSSHHVSESAIIPDHGNFLSQQARKHRQKAGHGNLLNLIESSADVSKAVLKLAQKQRAAFEDLYLFARDPRDHDGDNEGFVAVTEAMHNLNEKGAEASRVLVASQNAFVHTAEHLLLCYKQVEAREKALKEARAKQSSSESALESATNKEIKARESVKYEQNKPKLLSNITQCERRVEDAKGAVKLATEELARQRTQLKKDKEELIKQMLYSVNIAYAAANQAQLSHLETARAAILSLPGPSEAQLIAQAKIDNEPAGTTRAAPGSGVDAVAA